MWSQIAIYLLAASFILVFKRAAISKLARNNNLDAFHVLAGQAAASLVSLIVWKVALDVLSGNLWLFTFILTQLMGITYLTIPILKSWFKWKPRVENWRRKLRKGE